MLPLGRRIATPRGDQILPTWPARARATVIYNFPKASPPWRELRETERDQPTGRSHLVFCNAANVQRSRPPESLFQFLTEKKNAREVAHSNCRCPARGKHSQRPAVG